MLCVWAIVARRFLNVKVLSWDENKHKLRVIKISEDNSSTRLSKGSLVFHLWDSQIVCPHVLLIFPTYRLGVLKLR